MGEPHGPPEEREEKPEVHRIPRNPVDARGDERRGSVGPDRVHSGLGAAEGDDARQRDGRTRHGKDDGDDDSAGHVERERGRERGGAPHQARAAQRDDDGGNAEFEGSHGQE